MVLVFATTLSLIGAGCKTEQAAETTAAATEAAETTAAATEAEETTAAATEAAAEAFDMVNVPKMVGNFVFVLSHNGGTEAKEEVGNTGKWDFIGPTADNALTGQIDIVTNAVTQGYDAIILSNFGGDQVAPACKAAQDAGLIVNTYDSPVPSAEGESVFVAQVDFTETGKVLADQAREILGEDGGKFVVISSNPDAANQNAWIASLEEYLKTPEYDNLEMLQIAYTDDSAENCYDQALAMIQKYPDLEMFSCPHSIAIVQACKAILDEGLEDKIKVSGLGLASEMETFCLEGISPTFALWSFYDLGYLAYMLTYRMLTGEIKGEAGETFDAGRMGTYEITPDPVRGVGLRVLMGPFKIYTAENVSIDAAIEREAAGTGQ